jgi:predicted NBD/HSP70 family sugar kinase
MYFLFDIGGTNTRCGLSKDKKTLFSHTKIKTPEKLSDLLLFFKDFAKKEGGGESVEKCGGGIACPLLNDRETIIGGSHLPKEWAGENIKKHISSVFDECPVFLENDVGVVGLGELYFGAGKGSKTMVYITLSTGVNGARFINGHLAPVGVYGYEIGHQYIDIDKTFLPAYKNGTANEYLSGASMEKVYKKKPYEVESPLVWEEKALITAYLLHNTILYWSPDTIVLGGSMVVGNPAIPLESVIKHLKEIMNVFPTLPLIKKAELDSDGGLYGGLVLIK